MLCGVYLWVRPARRRLEALLCHRRAIKKRTGHPGLPAQRSKEATAPFCASPISPSYVCALIHSTIRTVQNQMSQKAFIDNVDTVLKVYSLRFQFKCAEWLSLQKRYTFVVAVTVLGVLGFRGERGPATHLRGLLASVLSPMPQMSLLSRRAALSVPWTQWRTDRLYSARTRTEQLACERGATCGCLNAGCRNLSLSLQGPI